ncbi:hypothetical protein [Streptomyces sp. NPDC021622]
MTPASAVAANLAIAVALLAASARLITWALADEPGRVHHDQEQPPT